METAIFPSYFHGKCQREDGSEPVGCPDPDCPVVCGTPGSLVHFYSKLRSIAFDDTNQLLRDLSSPGNDTYNAVKQLVLADAHANTHTPRMLRRYNRASVSLHPHLAKRDDAEAELEQIMKQIPSLLEAACGGDSLSGCSWQPEMVDYILSFN